MIINCPICGSDDITNKRNGQEPPIPSDAGNDELYIALDNSWYDGPVDLLECEKGHRFYMPNKLADDGYQI